MAVYSVTYDLRKEGQDYSGLIKALDSLTSHKYQLSAWLVKSSLTSQGLYNLLSPFIDKNDLILVIEVTTNKYGNLDKTSWPLINNLFQ